MKIEIIDVEMDGANADFVLSPEILSRELRQHFSDSNPEEFPDKLVLNFPKNMKFSNIETNSRRLPLLRAFGVDEHELEIDPSEGQQLAGVNLLSAENAAKTTLFVLQNHKQISELCQSLPSWTCNCTVVEGDALVLEDGAEAIKTSKIIIKTD